MSSPSLPHHNRPAYKERTWLFVIMTLWSIVLAPLVHMFGIATLGFHGELSILATFLFLLFNFCWTVFSLLAKGYFTTGNMYWKNSPWLVLAVLVAVPIACECAYPEIGYILSGLSLANYLLLCTTSWWKPFKLVDSASKASNHADFWQPEIVIVPAISVQQSTVANTTAHV